MIAGPLASVTADTIANFRIDAKPESPSLDFKKEAPPKTDDGRTEFLKDVCAFANGDGGDLIYGVATVNDVASVVLPISNEAADALKRRLTGYLDAEVEPRVSVEMHEVQMLGGFVLIVRVPSSFTGPHWYRVHGEKVPDHHRFALRSGTRTTHMDYLQVRSAFDRTSSVLEKARQFREARLEALNDPLEGSRYPTAPVCVLHVVPLSGMSRALVDVPAFYRSGPMFTMPGGHSPMKETNLDGVLMNGPRNAAGVLNWCIRVFRSGAIEFVREAVSQVPQAGVPPFIHAVRLSRELKYSCEQALTAIKWLDISGPTIFGVACLRVMDLPFRIYRNNVDYGNGLADRRNVVVPELWVEDISGVNDVIDVAKPMLDSLWQCFGEVECEMFKPGGEWALSASQ